MNNPHPPAATGIPHVDATLNRAFAGPVPNRSTRAGRSSKRLTQAKTFRDNGVISIEQYGQEVIIHTENGVLALPPHGGEPGFAQVLAALAQINGRFDQMDLRFNQMQEQMDLRFDEVYVGFDEVDLRFDEGFVEIDLRFDEVDLRLAQHTERFNQIDNQFANVRARQMLGGNRAT